MIDAHLVFAISIIAIIMVSMCYSYGIVSQRVLGVVGGPAVCAALAATVTVTMAPPPPPLTPAQQAKQKAQDDGYVVGLATGMMMPR
jgi:hypothetical protein